MKQILILGFAAFLIGCGPQTINNGSGSGTGAGSGVPSRTQQGADAGSQDKERPIGTRTGPHTGASSTSTASNTFGTSETNAPANGR